MGGSFKNKGGEGKGESINFDIYLFFRELLGRGARSRKNKRAQCPICKCLEKETFESQMSVSLTFSEKTHQPNSCVVSGLYKCFEKAQARQPSSLSSYSGICHFFL